MNVAIKKKAFHFIGVYEHNNSREQLDIFPNDPFMMLSRWVVLERELNAVFDPDFDHEASRNILTFLWM